MELSVRVSVKDLLCLCSFLLGITTGVGGDAKKTVERFEGKCGSFDPASQPSHGVT